MSNNNQEKKITRRRLAYAFGFGLVGYFFTRLVITVVGISIPDAISADLQQFVTLTGMILAFFFGGEFGGEKPEGT